MKIGINALGLQLSHKGIYWFYDWISSGCYRSEPQDTGRYYSIR